ncbi:Alkaline ceramidase [Camellia lanceoleosa]|uniref:Alkaline ceramidase n=1 Tax=Camellia lanceoleosa TaxID=1840588 RepID=A0ACC0GMP6_9ERIC|nr:Alkaline ceramidase [Camellia lanceoleosa]
MKVPIRLLIFHLRFRALTLSISDTLVYIVHSFSRMLPHCLINALSQHFEKRFSVLHISNMILAIGSMLYHATLQHVQQQSDETPMDVSAKRVAKLYRLLYFLVVCVGCLIVYSATSDQRLALELLDTLQPRHELTDILIEVH